MAAMRRFAIIPELETPKTYLSLVARNFRTLPSYLYSERDLGGFLDAEARRRTDADDDTKLPPYIDNLDGIMRDAKNVLFTEWVEQQQVFARYPDLDMYSDVYLIWVHRNMDARLSSSWVDEVSSDAVAYFENVSRKTMLPVKDARISGALMAAARSRHERLGREIGVHAARVQKERARMSLLSDVRPARVSPIFSQKKTVGFMLDTLGRAFDAEDVFFALHPSSMLRKAELVVRSVDLDRPGAPVETRRESKSWTQGDDGNTAAASVAVALSSPETLEPDEQQQSLKPWKKYETSDQKLEREIRAKSFSPWLEENPVLETASRSELTIGGSVGALAFEARIWTSVSLSSQNMEISISRKGKDVFDDDSGWNSNDDVHTAVRDVLRELDARAHLSKMFSERSGSRWTSIDAKVFIADVSASVEVMLDYFLVHDGIFFTSSDAGTVQNPERSLFHGLALVPQGPRKTRNRDFVKIVVRHKRVMPKDAIRRLGTKMFVPDDTYVELEMKDLASEKDAAFIATLAARTFGDLATKTASIRAALEAFTPMVSSAGPRSKNAGRDAVVAETVAKVLASAQPDLFVPNYTRACGKPPCVMPLSEDLSDMVQMGTAMKFPSDGDVADILAETGREVDQHYYTCNIEGFRFPGLRRNTKLDNQRRWPLIPCCFSVNQLTAKKTTYTSYLDNPAKAKVAKLLRQAAREGRIVGAKKTLASNSRYGRLPVVFSRLLFYVDSDVKECSERRFSLDYLLRRGTTEGPSSFLECVALGAGLLSGSQTSARALNKIRDEMASNVRFCLSGNVQLVSARVASALLRDKSAAISADLFLRAAEIYFGCRILVTTTSCSRDPTESCGLEVGLAARPGALPLEWAFGERDDILIVHSVRVRANSAQQPQPQQHYSLLYRTRCLDSAVQTDPSAMFSASSTEVRTLLDYQRNLVHISIPSLSPEQYVGTSWPQLVDYVRASVERGREVTQTIDGTKCTRSVTLHGVTLRTSPIPPLPCRIKSETEVAASTSNSGGGGTQDARSLMAMLGVSDIRESGSGLVEGVVGLVRVAAAARSESVAVPRRRATKHRLYDYQRLKHLSRCLRAYALYAFAWSIFADKKTAQMEHYLSLEAAQQWEVANAFVNNITEVRPEAYHTMEHRVSRHISVPFRNIEGFSNNGKLLIPDEVSREFLRYAVWMEMRATPWRLAALYHAKKVPGYYEDYWVWRNSEVSLSVSPGQSAYYMTVQPTVVENATESYFTQLLSPLGWETPEGVGKSGKVCLIGPERSSIEGALEDVTALAAKRSASAILERMRTLEASGDGDGDPLTAAVAAAENTHTGLAVQSYVSALSVPSVAVTADYVPGGLRLLTYLPSTKEKCGRKKRGKRQGGDSDNNRQQKWVAVLWQQQQR